MTPRELLHEYAAGLRDTREQLLDAAAASLGESVRGGELPDDARHAIRVAHVRGVADGMKAAIVSAENIAGRLE